MSCGCEEKKKFSILKDKKNLLELIRGISAEENDTSPHESETFVDKKSETLEQNIDTNTNTTEHQTTEDIIRIKKLEYILKKIDDLRLNFDTT
jgi:hypothetical protein